MRLHLPRKRGQVVNPFFGSNHRKEAATVTPADIIYSRRCHVIERAAIVGVSRACREAGVSRTSYYRWCARASRYGLSALVPKDRRRPAMPNGIPAHQEEIILAEALARPTLGARRLLEHLPSGGCTGPGRACTRSCTATTWGPASSVWQLTAVDTCTRWAFCSLMVGHVSSEAMAAYVKHLGTQTWKVGMVLRGVLSDNGPEFIGWEFRQAVQELGLTHHRIPPRSPDHNAVVERFHETVLQECYRPAFHRRRFDRLADLEAVLADFLHRYNTTRRNHGDYMHGRTPLQVLGGIRR